MVLGIIGEAGVGKSTAASFFENQGAYLISADLIVKYIYQLPETKKMILQKFGNKFLNDDETVDRFALRKYGFENYEFLKKLEAIIWPKMVKIIVDEIQQHRYERLIVLDCAVLFNVDLDYLVDKVLLIEATESLKINRIKARDKVSDDEARTLLNLQKNHLVLHKKNNFVIKNNGLLKDFLASLVILAKELSK